MQLKERLNVSKIILKITLITCFASLTIFSGLTYADYNIYHCKENGRNTLSEIPCKEGTLVNTTRINAPEKHNLQDAITQPAPSSMISPTDEAIQSGTYGIGNTFKQNEAQKAIDNAQLEAEERARIATEEAEERTRIATEEAEERARVATEEAERIASNLQIEMIRSTVRTRNSLYLSSLLLLVGIGVVYVIKRNNKEKSMNDNQKFGVITMIVSFLLILLTLMISDGWRPDLDYLANLMNTLRIELIELKDENYNPDNYYSSMYYHLIRWPTKYVVLTFLTAGFYGLTTYLGITPSFRPWKKKQ